MVGWGGGVVGGPCDYCVSPVQRIGFLGFLDLVRTRRVLGQGIGDLDSGLTKVQSPNQVPPSHLGSVKYVVLEWEYKNKCPVSNLRIVIYLRI